MLSKKIILSLVLLIRKIDSLIEIGCLIQGLALKESLQTKALAALVPPLWSSGMHVSSFETVD